jgi:hypothetical protein
MTWGNKWGDKWGAPLSAFSYQTFAETQIWKHLQYLPNIRALLDLIAECVGTLDVDIVQVATNVGIDSATGAALDDWGDLVDFPRLGANDDVYRRAIKAAARRLFASGRPDDFYDVISIASPTAIVKLLEIFPACVWVWIIASTVEESQILGSLLDGVPGLGICATWIESESQVFTWGHTDNDVPVEYHWGHTDGDIPDGEKAGFAFANVIQ